jgi:hypothetical protein
MVWAVWKRLAGFHSVLWAAIRTFVMVDSGSRDSCHGVGLVGVEFVGD